MEYLERNPRDPTRESQYSIAAGADKQQPGSIRAIPETPGGTRGPDPLMNYTLRPEDMVTIKKLGEGSAGTVSKVKHVPTGFVMARKVSFVSLDERNILYWKKGRLFKEPLTMTKAHFKKKKWRETARDGPHGSFF